ncbi:MAG: hypothetical protein EZS28_024914 [Streblomastix strix]|uniref:Uncharacterized protein n=1 Tax=Streblomastix strix TaxID=222440 RepID=A0A5J4VAQ4_9EUKA|nr:MAG: hypothetical protein EZS28_024914 [Streblomastix strix]
MVMRETFNTLSFLSEIFQDKLIVIIENKSQSRDQNEISHDLSHESTKRKSSHKSEHRDENNQRDNDENNQDDNDESSSPERSQTEESFEDPSETEEYDGQRSKKVIKSSKKKKILKKKSKSKKNNKEDKQKKQSKQRPRPHSAGGQIKVTTNTKYRQQYQHNRPQTAYAQSKMNIQPYNQQDKQKQNSSPLKHHYTQSNQTPQKQYKTQYKYSPQILQQEPYTLSPTGEWRVGLKKMNSMELWQKFKNVWDRDPFIYHTNHKHRAYVIGTPPNRARFPFQPLEPWADPVFGGNGMGKCMLILQ